MDPASLPVADHEQDGYIMVDLTEIVSDSYNFFLSENHVTL